MVVVVVWPRWFCGRGGFVVVVVVWSWWLGGRGGCVVVVVVWSYWLCGRGSCVIEVIKVMMTVIVHCAIGLFMCLCVVVQSRF